MVAVLAMALTFTSCDDDPWHDDWDYRDYNQGWYDDYDWYGDAFNYGTNTLNQEAQALRGYWTGQIENAYYDNKNQLQRVQMNAEFEFDQYDSNSLNGRGRETDYAPMVDDDGNYVYDSDGQLVYDSQELRFSWYIDPRTGDINIKYDGSGYEYKTEWDGGFSLNTQSKRFYGVFTGTNNNEQISFNLSRTTLAKPNVEAGAAATVGQTFGSRTGGQQTFSSPMGLRVR